MDELIIENQITHLIMNNWKRYYIVLFSLMLSIAAMAGDLLIADFEGEVSGWDVISAGCARENNPNPSGLNLSCATLGIGRSPLNDNWGGAIYRLANPITGYKYAHILMYRNNNHTPNLKVFDPAEQDGSADLSPVAGTVIRANEWQDVVFDITGMSVNFIFIMIDRSQNLTDDAIVFVDDIVLSNDATPRTQPNKACGASDDEYELVWNEDFTGGNLDFNAWNIEVNGDGGGNNELQYYCEKAVSVEPNPFDGKMCLVLTATKENYNKKTCTSGRVTTQNKMTFTYGKIEARIKFPETADGLWPAFWMLGNNISSVGWPRCGETDFVEMGHSNGIKYKTQDRYFNGAMHVGSAWDAVWQDPQSSTWKYSLQDTFHIVTVEWTPTSVTMWMDRDAHPELGPYFSSPLESNSDANYNRQVIWSRPNFIIFNLAVGGQFPNIYDVNKVTALSNGPAKMYVDWLRIYQRGDKGESFSCSVESDPIEGQLTGLWDAKDTNPGTKFIQNGQLRIRRGEHIYNIVGQIIQ